MSELRERVEKLVALFGGPQLGIERAIFIERIEAFAKEQQIKGMEAVIGIVVDEKCKHNSISTGDIACDDILEKIDVEIAKLKQATGTKE